MLNPSTRARDRPGKRFCQGLPAVGPSTRAGDRPGKRQAAKLVGADYGGRPSTHYSTWGPLPPSGSTPPGRCRAGFTRVLNLSTRARDRPGKRFWPGPLGGRSQYSGGGPPGEATNRRAGWGRTKWAAPSTQYIAHGDHSPSPSEDEVGISPLEVVDLRVFTEGCARSHFRAQASLARCSARGLHCGGLCPPPSFSFGWHPPFEVLVLRAVPPSGTPKRPAWKII